MIKERDQASFNSRDLTFFMDGGEAITKVKILAVVNFKFIDYNR